MLRWLVMLERYPEVELIRQEYLPPSQETVISSGSIRTDKLPSEGAGPPVRARETISPSLNSSTEKISFFSLSSALYLKIRLEEWVSTREIRSRSLSDRGISLIFHGGHGVRGGTFLDGRRP